MLPLPSSSPPLPESDIARATAHLQDVVRLVVTHDANAPALIVADAGCPLAATLAEAYRRCLPQARCIDFDTIIPAEALAAFAALPAGALVVLVQSTSFRLDGFRLRIELFKRNLKVIEHIHLARMPGIEAQRYIDGLAYDPAYYRSLGPALKQRIDSAAGGRVDSGEGAQLLFNSPFEPAKLNIGDYSGMANIGGQFPIGEVFTEARDLESVNGSVRIFVFGDTSFHVNFPAEPITLFVEKGRIVDTRASTPEFDQVLAKIRADEGEVWLRELGFGMNRAFSRERLVSDIGTFERMCGIHLSLGAKHGVYAKPGFNRKDARYHIDVFAVTEGVYLDEVQVYRDGAWLA